MSCDNCHYTTTTDATIPPTTVIAAGAHLNRIETVSFMAAGSYTATVGTKTCSSTVCHGTSSPKWGANTTNDTCTKCHGTGTGTVTEANRNVVAPPKDTAGGSGTATGTGLVDTTANSKIGAHQTHLQYLNGLRPTSLDTMDDRCGYCHGALPTSGNHANGSSAPSFQGLATRSGAMSPSYAGVTCTNTYCHNPAGTGGTLNTANSGTDSSPDWTDAGYIDDAPLKTNANCSICHKMPWDAGFASTYDHGTMSTSTDCSLCHGHNGSTTGTAGMQHMDGVKYGAGACNTCHGYEATSWATAPELAVEGKGAHAKHVAHLVALWGLALDPNADQFGTGASWTNVCGVCHNNATHIGATTRQISIVSTHQIGTSATSYTGVPETSSDANPKRCSNIDCHFQQTPVWSSY